MGFFANAIQRIFSESVLCVKVHVREREYNDDVEEGRLG